MAKQKIGNVSSLRGAVLETTAPKKSSAKKKAGNKKSASTNKKSASTNKKPATTGDKSSASKSAKKTTKPFITNASASKRTELLKKVDSSIDKIEKAKTNKNKEKVKKNSNESILEKVNSDLAKYGNVNRRQGLNSFGDRISGSRYADQFSVVDRLHALNNPSFGEALLYAKDAYNKAKTDSEKKAAHDFAEKVRRTYNYSGGTAGNQLKPLPYTQDRIEDISRRKGINLTTEQERMTSSSNEVNKRIAESEYSGKKISELEDELEKINQRIAATGSRASEGSMLRTGLLNSADRNALLNRKNEIQTQIDLLNQKKGFDQYFSYEKVRQNDDFKKVVSGFKADKEGKSQGIVRAYLNMMTGDEKDIFKYLYGKEGTEAAYEYVKFITSDFNNEKRAKQFVNRYENEAAMNPVKASVSSIVSSPLKGLSYAGQLADFVADGRLDDGAWYNNFTNYSASLRDGVSSVVEKKWGKVGSFLYQTGMSMGDFLLSAGISPQAALPILGSSAAADATVSAQKRGLSDNQSIALGTLAGLAETVFEKMSLDAFIKPNITKDIIAKYILKNTAIEASEEAATEIANTFSDVLVARDRSLWSLDVQKYVDQGFSKKEAEKQAFFDQLKAIGIAAAGGAISGGALSGGRASIKGLSSAVAKANNKLQTGYQNKLDREYQDRVNGQQNVEAAGAVQNADAERTAAAKRQQDTTDKQQKKTLLEKFNHLIGLDELPDLDESSFEEDLEEDSRSEPERKTGGRYNDSNDSIPENKSLKGMKASEILGKIYRAESPEKALPTLENIRDMADLDGDMRLYTGVTNIIKSIENGKKVDPEKVISLASGINNAEKNAIINWFQNGTGSAESTDNIAGFSNTSSAETSDDIEKTSDDTVFNFDKSLAGLNEKLDSGEITDEEYDDAYDALLQDDDSSVLYDDAKLSLSKTDSLNNTSPAQKALAAKRISDALGVDIKTYQQKYGANGMYYGGQIRANTASHESIEFIVAHELTHLIESSGTYKHIKDIAIASLGPTFYDEVSKVRELYNTKNGKNLNEEQIEQEVVADFVGRELLTNERRIVELTKSNRSIAEKILAWLDRTVARLTGDEAALFRSLYDGARQIYSKALSEAKEDLGNIDFSNVDEVFSGQIAEADKGVIVRESLTSWNNTDKIKLKNKLLKVTDEEGNPLYTEKQIDRWINSVNSVAAMIFDNKEALDYTPDRSESMVKPNAEYGRTLEASTLCSKRLLFQGTLNAIMKKIPDEMILSDDLIHLTNLLKEKGYESPCSICYVESRRRLLGQYALDFLDSYKGDYVPTYEELISTDGINNLKIEHPRAYQDFVTSMRAKGVNNPKLVQLRTDYREEISKFTKSMVETLNKAGGLRIQSFSDFEIYHAIDLMQALLDMTQKGLMSHAYTKVPEFALIFGNSGIKINLSLIPKGTGFDENGNLIFDSNEGMDYKTALKIRKKYSRNVGTISIGISDEHIKALMADPNIDFIIPFHKSGWGTKEMEALGIANYQDYENSQTESWINPKGHKDKPKVNRYDYWNDKHSGKRNAEHYLEYCAKNGIKPVFSQFLTDNGDGSYSLPSDGSADGFWKMLIDFKVYNNAGKPVPQEIVSPRFNMTQLKKAFKDVINTGGGANTLPVATDVVEKFVKDIKNRNQEDLNEKISEIRGHRLSKFNEMDKKYKSLVESYKKALESGYEDEIKKSEAKLTNMINSRINAVSRQGRDFGAATLDELKTIEDTTGMKANDIITYDDNGDVIPLSQRFDLDKPDVRYSLSEVEPVKPTTNAWKRSATFDEVKNEFPTLFELSAESNDKRNPTQTTSTIKTYDRIFSRLKDENFKGVILDASSGLGHGTRLGQNNYQFKIDDIEPFPDASYKPKFTDYSKLNNRYDVIISNAVLNVLPQDLRDAMAVKIGKLLKVDGRAYINVRGSDVENAKSKVAIDEDNLEFFIEKDNSYQKGFRKNELVAYLKDALGDDYTVESANWFGKISAIVTRNSKSFLLNKKINESIQKSIEQFSSKQEGVANKNNFMLNTLAVFEQIPKRPNRKPDYVSTGIYGDKSSEYWYEKGGVIRGSDHWGEGIASCDWGLKPTGNYHGNGIVYYGYSAWEDFSMRPTDLIDVGGKKIGSATFDNIISKNLAFVDRKYYKRDSYSGKYKEIDKSNAGVRFSLSEPIEFSITESSSDNKQSVLDRMPKRVQSYIRSQMSGFKKNITETLSDIPSGKKNEAKSIADEIRDEFLNSGGVMTEDRKAEYLKRILSYSPSYNDASESTKAVMVVSLGNVLDDSLADVMQAIRYTADKLRKELGDTGADDAKPGAELNDSGYDQVIQSYIDDYGFSETGFDSYANNNKVEGKAAVQRVVAKSRSKASEREKVISMSLEELEEEYGKLKKAKRNIDRINRKNFLTDDDRAILDGLLRGEVSEEYIDPDKYNKKGIMDLYKAKREREYLAKRIKLWNWARRKSIRDEIQLILDGATMVKEKKAGWLYARETMERNTEDSFDKETAKKINDFIFKPVHKAVKASMDYKKYMRDRVRALNISDKVSAGNEMSEAYVVQALGEAQANVDIMNRSKGQITWRQGKTLEEWYEMIGELHAANPRMDFDKIQLCINEFKKIYDELFVNMNKARLRNGYEPVNYLEGYFPHFFFEEETGLLGKFARTLGLKLNVNVLPTSINGMTHIFKPGIRWFAHANERLGFNTDYDCLQGFDRYIEGCSDVIHLTDVIQRLRAFSTQIRWKSSDEGIKRQMMQIRDRLDIPDDEKEDRIRKLFEDGKYELSDYVVNLDEYTNLLANKKSKYDREMESLFNRKFYGLAQKFESKVAANMIVPNVGSWLTNFIPLTQGWAQVGSHNLLKGMLSTISNVVKPDGLKEASVFLSTRVGSKPLVRTNGEKAADIAGRPMIWIDEFVCGAIFRGRYYQELKRGMSDAEAMDVADDFTRRVISGRTKGSMPTLFEARNPLYKMMTQFQLEVNNEFSYLFKDIPRAGKEKGLAYIGAMIFKFCLGAWLYDELYCWLIGRKPALDPISIINDSVGDITGYQIPSLVDSIKDLTKGKKISFKTEKKDNPLEVVKGTADNILSRLPVVGSIGKSMIGLESGGRYPVFNALPTWSDFETYLDKDVAKEKKIDTAIKYGIKLGAYTVLPFGGGQLKKIIETIRGGVEGGSYSVNKNGQKLLQYPMFIGDNLKGNILEGARSVLFGKSTLPTAREWIDNDFNSFTPELTEAYKYMLELGEKRSKAFSALKTINEFDAGDLTGNAKTQAISELISGLDISKESKMLLYAGKAADSEEADAIYGLIDSGVDINVLSDLVNEIYSISAEGLTGSDRKSAIIVAIDSAGLNEDQAFTMYKGFINTGYDSYVEDFLNAGISQSQAETAAKNLVMLKPRPGTDSVSYIDKYNAILSSGKYSAEQQFDLLDGQSYWDSYVNKVRSAYEVAGVTPEMFTAMQMQKYELGVASGSQMKKDQLTQAVNAVGKKMSLTNDQKAALWQTYNLSYKPKNNPYSSSVGQKVLDGINSATSKISSKDVKEFNGTKDFSLDEMRCHDKNGSLVVDKNLVNQANKIQQLRDELGVSLKVNSWYRTPEYNATVEGSAKNSYHTKGMATDIAIPSGVDAKKWAANAKSIWHEINGGGGGAIYYPSKGFVHFDSRETYYDK